MFRYHTLAAALILLAATHARSEEPGLTIATKVEGFTQSTQFNAQKYPFKYAGTSTVTGAQLKDLAKAGDVPAATTEALLKCLLWPEMKDKVQKASLKSDGKALTGEVEVFHMYPKKGGQMGEGTHVLKFKIEGTIENGNLTLKGSMGRVTGTWDWGGGMIELKGDVKVEFETKKTP